MNINVDLIKQFLAIRQDLLDSGVIAVDMWGDYIQVKSNEIVNFPNLTVIPREKDSEYPYTITTVVDGIKLLSVFSQAEFDKYHQLQGYMIEDVQLDGGSGDDHAA